MPAELTAAPPGHLKHPYWILAAICLLAMMNTIGVAMPYPILAPIFVAGPADGFTHFAGFEPSVLMGVALAVNPLGILLGSLVTGPMSDRYGRRSVMTVTLLATFVGYLVTAAALASRNYPLFVLSRFVTGLTESNTAVARALVADMHEQVDRTQAFAWLNACMYSGWLLGPLVGGLTLPFGEPVPFVLALWLPPSTPRPGAPHPQHPRGAMRGKNLLAVLRSDRVLGLVFGLQLAYTLSLTSMYEYAPLWMLKFAGLDGRGIAFVTAGQCAMMTLASAAAGRFGSASRDPLRRAAQCALVAAACCATLAVAPGVPGLAAIVVFGLPTALYNAVMPAWMSERFAAHGQGRVMGLLSTIFCVSNVVVAVAGGWIALLSTRWIMGLGGVAGVVAAALMLRLARTERAPGVAAELAS